MDPACLLTGEQALSYGSGSSGAAQIFTAIVVFLFVLALSYVATRIIGGFESKRNSLGNIEIIEVRRITANKYIEIVRIADKYLALAVTRDRISFLTELSPDKIEDYGGNWTGTKDAGHLKKMVPVSFAEFLNRAKKTVSGGQRGDEDDGD